jgi:prepilin-type N-terminal cleavage/methylation domain-containing protein/prepilin-type processing-associated H-X9-DG protein
MRTFPLDKRSRGLSLIELLVVIAIIGLLIALLLPAVQAARESARRTSCLNNLKQLALALHNYHDVNKKFPTGVRLPINVSDTPTGGTNLLVELLSYFEQENLHDKWDYDDNRNNVAGGPNATQAQVIHVLLCPSDPLPQPVSQYAESNFPWSWGFYGLASYGGNGGRRSALAGGLPDLPRMARDGVFFIGSSVRMADITDGAGNTLLFGERYHDDPEFDRLRPDLWPGAAPAAGWGRWGFVAHPGANANVTLSTPVPINYRVPPGGDFSTLEDRVCAFGSAHPGGANFAVADGSARFVAEQLALEPLQALSTRAGEEVVEAP